MGKSDKLIEKARNHPDGLSFKDFITLMSRCGWVEDHQRGSHVIWYSPTGYRISVQNKMVMQKDIR
ncbi:MAG: type II toxin-antitoxin system HicA family toxin [Gammaproteobacteria bacterium]